jgi:uncharacterized protein YjlB
MGEVETLLLTPGEDVPNSPLPVVLYRAAFEPEGDVAGRMERMFHANGWRGLWRNGIFAYHHFHDDAHEVLGIARGEATVQLGGEAGAEVTLKAGDVVVLPAGTGHKRLSSSPDLLVIGGYPAGQEAYATRRAGDGDNAIAARCADVPLPASDPLMGDGGALVRIWARSRKGREQEQGG